MVNIRLNEFDRKILANIKPSDKWNKFKNIFVLNSEIQKLKIGSSKVGTKCSQHLRKLSNKNIVTLEEIRDGCKDLIPKKHKHGLAKDKTKKDVLKEHTKLDIGQEKKKEEKPKHKKTATTKKPSPTQQLVNLLTAQQTAVRQQTIASNIEKVDQILTDRNQNVELPKQTQSANLQLTRTPLGQAPQLQLNRTPLGQAPMSKQGASITLTAPDQTQRIIRPSGIIRPLPRPIVRQNINGNIVGQTKTDEEILNQLRKNNEERLQNPNLDPNVRSELEKLDLAYKAKLNPPEDKSGAFRSLTSRLVDNEKNKRQNEILTELTTLGKMERQKQIEDRFDRNTRLNLEKSESLGDLQEQELELGRSGSFTARLPETKSFEEIQDAFRIAQINRDRLLYQAKPRKFSKRQKRKQEKAKELLELQEQEKQTSDLIDKIILDTEETNEDVDKFKKEMAQEEVAMEEVAMEEDKPKKRVLKKIKGTEEVAMEADKPVKMMSPDDVIGRPKSRYVIKSGLGTPSEVYGNADSTFYNKNYKDILNQYVNESRNSPIYNEPMKNNYAQTWDIINKIKNAKVYTADSKTKDLRHRKDYQKDLLKQLHARNVEQLMDRYLLEQNPEKKEYFKYAGIAAEQYFKSENPNEDPQYKLFNKISKRGKGGSISQEKFIEESKLLDVDNEDSKKWDSEAERLKEFHEEWDNEMSESAKRSYMAGSRDMFSAGLGQEGFNELPY